MAKFVVVSNHGLGGKIHDSSIEVQADTPAIAAQLATGAVGVLRCDQFGPAEDVWIACNYTTPGDPAPPETGRVNVLVVKR